jgi:hypothetical protein
VGASRVRFGFGHGSGQRIGASTHQNDLPAFFEQGECASFANAGTGTRDEGDLTHGVDFLSKL